jgi:hypothetical protein
MSILKKKKQKKQKMFSLRITDELQDDINKIKKIADEYDLELDLQTPLLKQLKIILNKANKELSGLSKKG